MKIGERVVLRHLLHEKTFRGVIVGIDFLDLCTVRLDEPDVAVMSVLYYPHEPEVVNSSLWQICWPEETEKPVEGANLDEPSCVHLDPQQ